MRGWILFCVVFLAAVASDLVTKHVVFDWLGMPGERRGVPVLAEVLSIETNLNEGALFGMGQGMGSFFAIVSVGALLFIVAVIAKGSTRADPVLVTALGLIAGGIVGNLYDRLGLPGLRWHAPLAREGSPVFAVRDWIHFRLEGIIDWPIFNLADSWLVIGSTILLVASLRPPRTEAESAQATPTP